MNTLPLVHNFQTAFDQPMSDGIPSMSQAERNAVLRVSHEMAAMGRHLRELAQAYGKSVVLLRLQLMQEELAEVAGAFAEEDKVALLGELCDLRYVVDGTVLTVGMEDVFLPAFCDVHESNMSKLEDGRPVIGPEGRVQKGRFYKKHNLAYLLAEHRAEDAA